MRHITFLLTVFCTLTVLSTKAQDDLKVDYFFKALVDEDYEKINRYLESGISINHEKIVKERDRVDRKTYQGPVTYHASKKSRTPLIRAIELRKPELVRFLVNKGADVNYSLNVVWYTRCEECPTDIYGQKPMKRNTMAYRPISWAIDRGNLDIIDFLISKGADYSRESERIRRTGKKELIDYFTEKGMKLEFTSDDIDHLYKKSYSEPKKDFIRSLIKSGAEVKPKTLYTMLERKDTASLRTALDNGADVNEFYIEKELRMCLLCKATIMCDMGLIEFLVEDYKAKSKVVCDFYMAGDRKRHSLTPMEIARHKYIGKCKGRNDRVIEYFLWLEE